MKSPVVSMMFNGFSSVVTSREKDEYQAQVIVREKNEVSRVLQPDDPISDCEKKFLQML